MGRPATIHLSDATLTIIGQPPEPSLSGRIAGILGAYAHACDVAGLSTGMDDAPDLTSMLVRYRRIITESTPALTEGEWSMLCDVLNGSWIQAEHGDSDPARFLHAEVADADPETLEKWGVDADFWRRVECLSYPSRCAVLEVVAAFWRQDNRLVDLRTALGDAGGVFSESPAR